MTIEMRRRDYQPTHDCEHAGLLLDCGFQTWGEDHPEKVMQLHEKATDIGFSTLYQAAFDRWKETLTNNPKNSKTLEAKLENRMYLGLGESSPLEAGIILHHIYGVPFIPGTAIKGVLHHYAQELGIKKKIQNVLFGREPDATSKRDSGEAGYIIFNDAWWIPGGNALAPEMITVHYPKYYDEKGANHTDEKLDFESPNPNPQIAIRGSFLFSVEGDEAWAGYAIKLLVRALAERGVGGKFSSGYGLFSINEPIPPEKETWENANLRKISARGGDVLQATISGKTATVKWKDIQPQIKALGFSNAKSKKLGKSTGITQSVTVSKKGNAYKIITINTD